MSDGRTRAVVLAALLVVGAVAGVTGFAGSVAAAESATISTSPTEASATATHTVDAAVEENDDSASLNEIEVDYSVSASAADVSNVGVEDVVRVGKDIDADGEIEVSTEDDLSSADVTNNGETLHFYFGGSYQLNASDHVIVEYEDVQNPDATGNYTVDVAINTQSTDNPADATLRIGDFEGPTISNYTVTNPENREIRVAFDASENLTNVTVTIEGAETATLTEENFTVSGDTYVATYCACGLESSADNSYTVTLTEAEDDAGNGAASTPTESVEVVDPAFVAAGSNPSSVVEGTTVNNQEVTVSWENVSADGNSDTFYVAFADALASSLSVNGASTNVSGGIAQSAELVDGPDDDGVAETVRFQVNSGEGGGTVSLSTTVDVSVHYPAGSGGTSYAVDARVEDSDGATANVSDVAGVTIEQSSTDDGTSDTTAPTISNYAVTAVDGDVRVSFESSERLSVIEVQTSGDVETTLQYSAFAETWSDGAYEYAATLSAPANATVTAELVTAEDGAGNDGASGETDSATTAAASTNTTLRAVGGSATPATVAADETVNNQKVTVSWENVSADGNSDTFYVVFADELAGNLSVNGASTNVSGGIAQSAELVDGPDDDGVAETVRFQVNSGDGGGTVSLSTTVDVSVQYPNASTNTTFAVDAVADDSDGRQVSADSVAEVTVDATGDAASTVEEITDGGVTTTELRSSISLWIQNDISTEGLRTIITAWVSG